MALAAPGEKVIEAFPRNYLGVVPEPLFHNFLFLLDQGKTSEVRLSSCGAGRAAAQVPSKATSLSIACALSRPPYLSAVTCV